MTPGPLAKRVAFSAAAACLVACSSVAPPSPMPTSHALQSQVQALAQGRSTMEEALRLWGEPHAKTRFMQGHEVWHYYLPKNGWAVWSRVPGVHLGTAERGRRAVDLVLLFNSKGVVVQGLVRDLPGEAAQEAAQAPGQPAR